MIKNCLLFISILFLFSCTESSNEIPPQEKDFCASIHITDSTSLSDALFGLEDSMKTKTGVYVLEDGGGSLITRAWLSEHAEKTIDIQYFIFSSDNVGLIACDYLVRAADRGVMVRILIDDIMVDAGIYELLTLDSHKNIEIKVYNPGVNLGKNIVDKVLQFSTNFRSANQRMHNKTFVVDGKVVITGGRNIADEYFDYDHEYNFRDRDVLLVGKSVADVQSSFTQFWDHDLSVAVTSLVKDADVQNTDTTRFERLHQYACNPANFWPQVRDRIANASQSFQEVMQSGKFVWVYHVQFVSDVPGKNDGSHGLAGGGVSTDSLIALVQRAKVSIDIQSPYLITTDLGRNLFKDAVQRGVKVRILTNSLASTDNLEAFSGYQRDRAALLATGVEIYEFKPDAAERYQVMTGALQEKINFTPIFGLHAKSMVVDGVITVIGTFNLDPRSANLNTECVTIIYDKQISTHVLTGMEVEFHADNAWHTSSTFNPDAEAGTKKQVKMQSRKVVPKNIL